MIDINFFIFLKKKKLLLFAVFIFTTYLIFYSQTTISQIIEPKNSINGSGLTIPRMVSLKNELTFVRTGPGKEFPIKFEINQKGYPLKIIAEFNNWRKVNTKNNLSGWIHTQLLSSFKTGLIIKETVLKKRPLNSSKNLAILLPDLLIKIKKCKSKWCNVEVFRNENFVGWVKKKNIWDSVNK